jgi:hypothetical protein
MTLTMGTSHFVSSLAAIRYYKAYGESAEDVRGKIDRGEIHNGMPKVPLGHTLRIIPDEGRYETREMNFSELEKRCTIVVDDTGNGREIGADQHAIVRRGGVDDFCNRSAFAVFPGEFNQEIVVAVNSYLDVWLDDEEVTEFASDFMAEMFRQTATPLILRG